MIDGTPASNRLCNIWLNLKLHSQHILLRVAEKLLHNQPITLSSETHLVQWLETQQSNDLPLLSKDSKLRVGICDGL